VPRGEPLHPYLPNSFVDARINPEFMLRLVNVEGALRLLDCRSEAFYSPFVLEIEDDAISENSGEYTVGGGGVIRGTEAEDRVALDVRQLAQLYAGYLSARQLARRDLVRPSSAKALELLETFFPCGDPYVSPPDDF
jgi:predicted acetyltransferase